MAEEEGEKLFFQAEVRAVRIWKKTVDKEGDKAEK
jgi:hypothetical protein